MLSIRSTKKVIKKENFLHQHGRHGPFCVACKTYTKSSTYVKYVMKFANITNLMPILRLCDPHNCQTCQLWLCELDTLKICTGFVTSANLITYLTNVEGFVSILRSTQKGSCLRCYYLPVRQLLNGAIIKECVLWQVFSISRLLTMASGIYKLDICDESSAIFALFP